MVNNMPKKSRTQNCVTTSECEEKSRVINNELATIKKALIGGDMRGGIVRDLADIKAGLKMGNNNGSLGKKTRVSVYTSAIVTAGLLVAKVIEFFS